MTEHEADDFLQKCVRQQRTIGLALLGGPVVMAIVFVALHFGVFDQKPLIPDLPRFGGISVLTFVASFVAVSSVVVTFILNVSHRAQTVQRVARQSPSPSPADGPALLVGWQVGTLVRFAMIEGATILALIMFLVTGDFAALAIAAILIAIQAVGLPSETSARGWLHQADEELQRVRSGATDSL